MICLGPFRLRVTSLVVSCCKHVWKEHKIALLSTLAVVVVVKGHRCVQRRKLRQKWDSVGENVVVLHGIERSRVIPNLSPFVLKLETYLRMAGIKYEFDSTTPRGTKGKFPWITLNGEDYTDSQLIVDFLGKKFNKNFSSSLDQEQLAVARSMLIMTDEHILWGLAWWRFLIDPDMRVVDLLEVPCKHLLLLSVKSNIRKGLNFQGIGRHSETEIEEMIRKDIEALSFYLGNKPFLMGDTPCEVDCAVFGMMSQFVWGLPGSPFASMLQSDYRNLLHYCIRMKEKFWPDWDNVLLK